MYRKYRDSVCACSKSLQSCPPLCEPMAPGTVEHVKWHDEDAVSQIQSVKNSIRQMTQFLQQNITREKKNITDR